MQAEQIPVSNGFYTSFVVAVLIFVVGLCVIYSPVIIRIYKMKKEHSVSKQQMTLPVVITPAAQKNDIPTKKIEQEKFDMPARPPKLNLPSNMAQIAKERHEQQINTVTPRTQDNSSPQYDSELSQIFTDAGYVVKKNLMISGFSSNLFAIAPNEILWIGAFNKDITKLQNTIDRLQSIFQETLEDIKININAFMVDTTGQQQQTDSIFVFHSLDELKKFVSELPPVWPNEMTNSDQENFDAYSEYIDTIIQYVKNIG